MFRGAQRTLQIGIEIVCQMRAPLEATMGAQIAPSKPTALVRLHR